MRRKYLLFLWVLLSFWVLAPQVSAMGKITLTTSRQPGETIELHMKAVDKKVSMTGVKETATVGYRTYTLTSSTVVIDGEVTFFAANGNDITDIDLSSCTILETLQLSNNTLTTLDLNANQNLKSVFCFGSKIQNLILGNSPNLADLRCHLNGIKEINLGGLPKLKKLWIYDNILSVLDVSANPLLEELFCERSPLKILDLSNNPELKKFYCSGCELTSINIKKNEKLVEFTCYGNQLEKIELPASPELKRIVCFGNKISDREMQNLVNSLPVRTKQDHASLIVVDSSNEKEANVCTKNSVNVANEKNWNVYAYSGGVLSLYPGCDIGEEPEEDVFIKFHTNRPIGTLLTCYGDTDTPIEVEGADVTFQEPTTILLTVRSADIVIKGNFFAFAIQDAGVTEIELKEPNLLSLYVEKNELKTINVSDCPNLLVLNVEQNEIETLDLSKVPNLDKLMCGGNKIEALDLSENLKLVELRCENNRLKQLDLFQNSAISRIYCYNNQISKFHAVEFFNKLPSFSNYQYTANGLIVFVDQKSASEGNAAFEIDVQVGISKKYSVVDFSGGELDDNGSPMLPLYNGEPGGEDGREWKLYVGGLRVLKANADDIFGDGGSAKYIPETKTLTLTNVEATSLAGAGLVNSGVDELTIKLVGENSLRASSNSSYVGFGLSRSTRFLGPGSLTIKSATSAGINLNKTQLTFEDCSMKIVGKIGIAGVDGKSGELVTVKKSDLEVTGLSGAFFMANLVLEDCEFENKDEVSFSETDRMVVDKNKKLFTGTFKIRRTKPDSISPIGDDGCDKIIAIYDLQGRKLASLQPGVNIVVRKSGRAEKVLVADDDLTGFTE